MLDWWRPDRRARGQSDFQGPEGDLGFEQDLAQCPSLLRVKHGPGGGLAPDLPAGGLALVRVVARSWKAS